MFKKIMIITILTLLIAGCTPDQTADQPPAQNTAESAVDPVEGENGVVANPDVTLVAPSEPVNLGEMTPAPATDEESEIIQPAPGVPDSEARMVQLAAEHLAERLGIDTDGITLVEAVSKEWPDAGLGCPSPDMFYAAVITPGFEITLEAQEQNYTYHTDTGDTVILCIDGRPAE